MRLTPALALLLALLLPTGCSTPPSDKEKAELLEAAAPAVSIYHCVIEVVAGAPHFRLKEVWVHDPQRGAPPSVGAEILASYPKSRPQPGVTSVLIFIYDPPLQLPNGNSMPNRTVYVFGRDVPAFHLSLTHVERILRTRDPRI